MKNRELTINEWIQQSAEEARAEVNSWRPWQREAATSSSSSFSGKFTKISSGKSKPTDKDK